MSEMGMKTKYIILIMNHNTTVPLDLCNAMALSTRKRESLQMASIEKRRNFFTSSLQETSCYICGSHFLCQSEPQNGTICIDHLPLCLGDPGLLSKERWPMSQLVEIREECLLHLTNHIKIHTYTHTYRQTHPCE